MNRYIQFAFCNTRFIQHPRSTETTFSKKTDNVACRLKRLHQLRIPLDTIFESLRPFLIRRTKGLKHSGTDATKQLAQCFRQVSVAGVVADEDERTSGRPYLSSVRYHCIGLGHFSSVRTADDPRSKGARSPLRAAEG